MGLLKLFKSIFSKGKMSSRQIKEEVLLMFCNIKKDTVAHYVMVFLSNYVPNTGRFYGTELIRAVKEMSGRDIFDSTILRTLRKLRAKGCIDYKVLDKGKSEYLLRFIKQYNLKNI